VSLEVYAAALVAVMLIACAIAPWVMRNKRVPEVEPYERELEPDKKPWRRTTVDVE
jgi:hypothetical protein